MTNKDDDISQNRDPRVATVLAIHLVKQVLDEAYIIANAAQESGEPWQYLSGQRNNRRCSLNDNYDKSANVLPLLDISTKYNDMRLCNTPNKVVTSTPQKSSGYSASPTDHTLIGQGDEEFIGETDDSKSTSMFIKHIFDMSDVEREMSFNEIDMIPDKVEPKNLITIAMKTIMESFIDSAINTAFGGDTSIDIASESLDNNTISSSYSFLDDANSDDANEEPSFNLMTDNNSQNGTYSKQLVDHNATTDKHDFACYEKAFLTLNRDYEQYSDEDEEPVLQDPKGLCLQEIELMTKGSSCDILPLTKEMKKKEFAAVSGVSSSGLGSKKSSIIRRCRTHGARLMACFRSWWWRRKIPGNRKETRLPGSIRGICPLSPDARRRAASLLDNRQLRSPSPSRSVMWKFNTINEALVHSAQWKEYTSNIDFNENDNC